MRGPSLRNNRACPERVLDRRSRRVEGPVLSEVPRHRRGRAEGFTLIEIVVVVLIIGMVLVAALAGFSRPMRFELSEAGQTILATVETCRARAILSGSKLTFVYDLDASPQKTWIEIPSLSDPSAEPERALETDLPGRIHLKSIWLDAATRRDSGQVRLLVQPTGFLPPHLVHLAHREAPLEGTAVLGPFPGQARFVQDPPDWDAVMRTETERDVPGVKPLPEEPRR